jgi:Group II intron, maturase-specific domain
VRFPRATHPMLICRSRPQPALAACEAIATRMELTLNRDKTRVTRLTDGCDFLGFQCVKRKSPRSGKNTISLFPAQSAQQKMRNRLKYLTSSRAPIRPQAFVDMVNPIVLGWVHDCRHTNASQAFRGLQRFVNIRLRRYLPQRRKGRGLGGNASQTASCMPWGSCTLAVACSNTWRNLRMVRDEDCRTAVLGKTARTVGWEGDGDPIMMGLVRHCNGETRSNC